MSLTGGGQPSPESQVHGASRQRLVSGHTYVFDGNGSIEPRFQDGDLDPDNDWIRCEFASGTFCNTDKSNAEGAVGHGGLGGTVVGHECCLMVVESHRDGIEDGQFVVPLGDDFRGLAETSIMRPVLPGDDVPDEDLIYVPRGTFFDPREGYKAVLVLDEWLPGASLIEPAAHVLTSLGYNNLGSETDQSRKTALIAGAGLCGQIACSFLREWHPNMEIIVMDPDKDRLDAVLERELADDALDPSHGLSEIKKLIEDSKGSRVDTVIDALPALMTELPGDEDSRVLAARLIRPGGNFILFGAAEAVKFPVLPILAKGVSVGGAPYDSRVIGFGERAQHMQKVHQLAAKGVLNLSEFLGPTYVDFFNTTAVVDLFAADRSGPYPRTEIRNSKLISSGADSATA